MGSAAGSRGLRREEVAMLAGVSVEYYLRLEQGRDLHPSDQILDGIAAALQLDDDARAYLHRLAHPAPRPGRRGRPRPSESGLRQLIDSWPATPGYAQGPAGRVVAANRLAAARAPVFGVGGPPPTRPCGRRAVSCPGRATGPGPCGPAATSGPRPAG